MTPSTTLSPTPSTLSTAVAAPGWMKFTLRLAAVYNVIWGAWVVLFPNHFFELVGMTPPTHTSIWQCVGMIVGVYGIGYWIAGNDPARHWPIILVGFLGKIFGPAGYVQGAFIDGTLDPAFGWTIPTNDLIWWIPFAMILWYSFRMNQGQGDRYAIEKLDAAVFKKVLDQHPSQSGQTLNDLSSGQTVFVLFLRHAGCTFCREALADLAKQQEILSNAVDHTVIITQSHTDKAVADLEKFGLSIHEKLHVISDPDTDLYRAFELQRGRFLQLFGPKVWLSGFRAIKYGVGPLDGDGLQMPGAFVLRDGQVIKSQRHEYANDRIDACAFVNQS